MALGPIFVVDLFPKLGAKPGELLGSLSAADVNADQCRVSARINTACCGY